MGSASNLEAGSHISWVVSMRIVVACKRSIVELRFEWILCIWFPKARRFWISRAWRFFAATRPWKACSWASWPYEHPSHISHDTWRGKNPVTGADTYLSAGCDIADAGSYTSRWFCWANCSFFVLRFSVPQARCRCCTCTGAPVCGRRRFSVPSIGISSTSAQHQTTAVLIKGNHHSWHVVFTFLCCPPVQTLYQSARFLARKRCLALILLILLRKRVTGETDLASHHIPPFFSGISKSMDSILRWTILKGL